MQTATLAKMQLLQLVRTGSTVCLICSNGCTEFPSSAVSGWLGLDGATTGTLYASLAILGRGKHAYDSRMPTLYVLSIRRVAPPFDKC